MWALIFVYLFMKVVLLGVGIGIGWALHWMVPQVDLGMGILIGLLATIASIHFYTRLNAMVPYVVEDDEEEADEDEKDYPPIAIV
jgi:F0F1-type ATP synthase assembly protein I